jgi:hypothetical protein
MFSRKNERKVLPSTDDHTPSAAHSPQPLDGAEGVATSGLAAESGMQILPPPDHPDLKIHPAGQTDTSSSPKQGEQIGARIQARDAASTASKDGNTSKPPKQMLPDWKQMLSDWKPILLDWKWRLRRSASYAGSLKPDATHACSAEFDRCERKLIYKTGMFKYVN